MRAKDEDVGREENGSRDGLCDRSKVVNVVQVQLFPMEVK